MESWYQREQRIHSFAPNKILRMGLNWATDPDFSLEAHRSRFIQIIKDQVHSVAPIPVVYMIDHPNPFTVIQTECKKRRSIDNNKDH